MNEEIMLLSNRLIYGDKLRCGSAEVAQQSLRIPRTLGETFNDPALAESWMAELLLPGWVGVLGG
jgi:DNA replication ATP-dependent helicase Dna2